MPEFTKPVTEQDLQRNFAPLKPLMTSSLAREESSRCLFCHDAPCVRACPTEIDIPMFIRQIHSGNLAGAAGTIYSANYFGNICGKVCPTEALCEGACVYNNLNSKPVEIGRLQTFATATSILEGRPLFTAGPPTGRKVAVIGAGPAGISCAGELRRLGHEVAVFEARPYPSGLAISGCAPYKVSNLEVLGEVRYLQEQLQFQIHYNRPIERKEQFRELEDTFDAVFLGIGLGATTHLNLPGARLDGCLPATTFIEAVRLTPLSIPPARRVVIIGGGNTAMDAASESARLGAEEVVLAYRRARAEKPAYEFEFTLAQSCGIRGMFNVSPLAILGTEKVSGVRLARNRMENGRLVDIPGSEFELACDRVILATGQSRLIRILEQIAGLELDDHHNIRIDPVSFQTTHPRYFAAGDAVNGGREVVHACAEGKKAASGIDRFLAALR